LAGDGRGAVILRDTIPRIAGLSVRGFRGESDFPIMADVMQKSRDSDLFDVVENVDDVAGEFEHLQNCDPHEDLMFIDADGQTIGFCRCEWHDGYGHVRKYNHWAHLVPEWRKEGLREAMLIANETRLVEISSGHDTDRRRFLETRAVSKPNDWMRLLETHGYRPHNHTFLMTRPLAEGPPDLPLADGYIVRDVEKEHLWPIWKAAEEAFRDEPSFIEEIWGKEGFEWLCGLRVFRPALWQIAWKGDEIAGGVLNFIDQEENEKYGRNWGYTQAIFVRKTHRHKGLASALIARSLDVLKAEGVSHAALTVDTDNPSGALKLYEKMGFRTDTQYTCYRRPLH